MGLQKAACSVGTSTDQRRALGRNLYDFGHSLFLKSIKESVVF